MLGEYEPWQECREVTVTIPGAMARYGVEGVTLPYVAACDAPAVLVTAELIAKLNLARLRQADII